MSPAFNIFKDTAWEVVLPTGASESKYELVKCRQKQSMPSQMPHTESPANRRGFHYLRAPQAPEGLISGCALRRNFIHYERRVVRLNDTYRRLNFTCRQNEKPPR